MGVNFKDQGDFKRMANAVKAVERSSLAPLGDTDDQSSDVPPCHLVKVKTEASAGRKKYVGTFLRSPEQTVNFYNLQEQEDGDTLLSAGDYVAICPVDFDWLKDQTADELAAGNNWATVSLTPASTPTSITVKEYDNVPSVSNCIVIAFDNLNDDLYVEDMGSGIARVTSKQPVRHGSGTEIVRRRLNFNDTADVSWSVVDDAGSDETDLEASTIGDTTGAPNGFVYNMQTRDGLVVAFSQQAGGQTHTIPLAKLTAKGSNGSASFTLGILTAYVDPT